MEEISRRKFIRGLGIFAAAPSLAIPRRGYSQERRYDLYSKFPDDFFQEYGTTREDMLGIVKMSTRTRIPKGSLKNFSRKVVSVKPSRMPYIFEGPVSFYTTDESNKLTATGAPFSDDLPTIALNPRTKAAIPALVRIISLEEKMNYGNSAIAIANDRGPYMETERWGMIPHNERIADLSTETLNRLGFYKEKGLFRARVEILETYDIG